MKESEVSELDQEYRFATLSWMIQTKSMNERQGWSGGARVRDLNGVGPSARHVEGRVAIGVRENSSPDSIHNSPGLSSYRPRL